MYEALYSPSEGQCAYRCKVLVMVDSTLRYCGKVTKSYRGIKAHAWLVHGLRQQIVMDKLVDEAKLIDSQVEEERKHHGEKKSERDSKLQSVRGGEAGSGGSVSPGLFGINGESLLYKLIDRKR